MTGDAGGVRGPQRLYDLVARALEAPPDRRRELVEGACGEDTALRDEVLRVVGADGSLGGFLKTPAPARFDALVPPGPPLPPGSTVGRYHLVRVLGSGGSGAVYEALQESPRRKVALKIMAAGLGSTGAVNRFREEAEILARMSHAGIAHVYEAGVHREDGVRLPWLAIEHVEGRDIVAHAAGLPVRGRLELMARVCDAVHHGHEQGILHGDLKPTNILVDVTGAPKVIDFGVARALGGEADGDIAGTPPYMSPEQCEPQGRLDVRSDVYSLGAVLYEILCGRRARDVGDLPLPAALEVVRKGAPAPVESVDPRLGGDVAAIVGKALARDRAARYSSAAALADDIRRHLAHRPVEARAQGLLYVAGRFARREPLVTILAAAIVALSVGAAAAGARLALQKERQREAAERQAYVASLAAASAALRAHDVVEARQQLQRAPEQLRGWEWRHLSGRLDDSVRTFSIPGCAITAGAVSADGTRAAVVTLEVARHISAAALLDLETGAVIARHRSERAGIYTVGIEPSGARAAFGYIDGAIEIRDAVTGSPVATAEAHDGMVNALSYDPRGRFLASAGRDRTIRFWDPVTCAAVASIDAHDDRVICLAFDATGERLASGGREGTVRIWDVARRSPIAVLRGHEGSVEGIAWSPDGRRLASASRDRTVRLWDAASGAALAVRHGHENNVRAVAFAPDGRTFASASWDRTVRLWSGEDGRALACLHGHEAFVFSITFLQRTGRILSFGGDIKTWRVEPREDVPVLYGHRDAVRTLAFAPGGGYVASGGDDGTVRLWDLAGRKETTVLDAPSAHVDGIAFVGTRLVALANGMLRSWTISGGKGGAPGRDVATFGCRFAGMPRADTVLVGCTDGTTESVDLAAGTRGPRNRVFDDAVTAVACGPRPAAASASGAVAILDPETLLPAIVAKVHEDVVHALAFSPDGSVLASASRDGRVLLLDARTLDVTRAIDLGSAVWSVAFHPDGTRLATGGDDGTVRLWDARTGDPQLVLHGPRFRVWSVAWSPDGACLASAEGSSEATDSCIRLWEGRGGVFCGAGERK